MRVPGLQAKWISVGRMCPLWLGIAVICTPCSARAAAEDCPTAQSGRTGFIVERGEQQKSEVFHVDDGLVRTTMRYQGRMLLEKTLYEGFFDLERLDRGQKIKFEPQTDLKKLFPLKTGQTRTAEFTSEAAGRQSTLAIEIRVKGTESIFIGACKYNVLKIERSESRGAAPPRFVDAEYYSPELKLVLAREYRKGTGTELIKYDRIYTLNR